MGWQNDIAVKWHNDTRSLAAQLCREPLDSQSAWQALDAFSAGHYVSFGGSRDSRTKKATDLLAALGQVPSQVLRGITAQQDPTTPRSVAAQKVLRALHEVVDASDALVQMHAAADSMRVALVKGSDDLVRDALQAWQLCLATAKCQTSTPALRRVQVTFLESALAYCLQHGILLAEMACEVRELLADGRPLTTLSRVTAQQLPTLALMTASDHTLEDGFALSRAVWEAVSRLMWDRPDWFADPAVHDACCKVRTRVCNAWVAAGGKLTDPGAPAVLTAEDIQPVKRPAKHGSSVHAVPEMPRHLEPEPHLPAPCADNPTASRSDVSQAAPLAPTEAATHVQLESHRLPPPAAGLADHMGVPEEIEGLVRLSRIRRDAAHLQEYSMLLCGPPGCGKTSLARRLAATLDLPIYAFSGAELMSVYQGGPGLRVQNLFSQLREAAAQHPRGLVLFIDEAGRLLNDRATTGTGRDDEGATESFLYEMQDGDGPNANILVVCATNHAERIDTAVASRLLHIPLEPLEADKRAELFLRELKSYDHNLTSEDAKAFIATCPDLAGRDIKKLLTRAQLLAASRVNGDEIMITAAALRAAWKKMERGRAHL